MFSGGTVHMVCRNKDKAEEARMDIVDKSGNTVSTVCQAQAWCVKSHRL